MQDFGLYVIVTKPMLSYEAVAEICVENRVKMLQLREKDLTDTELLKIAKRIRNITKNTETKFIVNDRPDIAKLCAADAVHLGQDDIALERAKKVFGRNKLYGLSTHSIAQAQTALQKKPAYIGFGPIFPTPTKAIPDPTIGTEPLAQAVKLSTAPLVAIGGIFPDNIEQVLKAGARNIAMVRYFMQTKNLGARIKEIQLIIDKWNHC